MSTGENRRLELSQQIRQATNFATLNAPFSARDVHRQDEENTYFAESSFPSLNIHRQFFRRDAQLSEIKYARTYAVALIERTPRVPRIVDFFPVFFVFALSSSSSYIHNTLEKFSQKNFHNENTSTYRECDAYAKRVRGWTPIAVDISIMA